MFLPFVERLSSISKIWSTMLIKRFCSMDISEIVTKENQWKNNHEFWSRSEVGISKLNENVCWFVGPGSVVEWVRRTKRDESGISVFVFARIWLWPKDKKKSIRNKWIKIKTTNVSVEWVLLLAFFVDNHRTIAASFVVYVWSMFSDLLMSVELFELNKKCYLNNKTKKTRLNSSYEDLYLCSTVILAYIRVDPHTNLIHVQTVRPFPDHW